LLSNFLAALPVNAESDFTERVLCRGIHSAEVLKQQTPGDIVRNGWCSAAVLARQNGSYSPIASDERTGSWLLAAGTWFSRNGYAVGQERKLLQEYRSRGAFTLARTLEGFFTIIVADGLTRELVVITDIVGSHHSFVRELRDGIVLSGSSLLLAAIDTYDLDPVGCQEFVNTGVIYEDRTLFRQVKKLRAATVLRFGSDRQRAESRYWSFGELQTESLDGQTGPAELWERLVGAATTIGRAFPKAVCDLTGGYDSRALVAGFLGARLGVSSVVSGPPDSADVRISRGLAEIVNLPHVHISTPDRISFSEANAAIALTDGEYNLFDYAQILRVHRQLAAQFQISINGSFGEVARGYWWELLFPRTGVCRPLDCKLLARKRLAAKLYDPNLFAPECTIDMVSHLAAAIERTNSGLTSLPNTLQMDHVYLMMRMQRWQGRIASSTNQLWPCLSPFMFRSVLESMLKTKSAVRQRSLLVRAMLVRFQPQWANYPLEHGYPAIPAHWSNLHRFLPLASFYAGRVAAKLRKGAKSAPQSELSTRAQAWKDDRVQELLEPSKMHACFLFNPRRLPGFLQESREPGFSWDGQWMRLLSLEAALGVLESGRFSHSLQAWAEGTR
jgi:hypothetical protein